MTRQRERSKDAKRRSLAAMKDLVSRSKNKNNLPHMAVFYEKLFEAFDGADGFTQLVRQLFNDPETRNSDKVRLLLNMTEGVKSLYDRGLTKNTEDEDPSLMSDEQIEAEMFDLQREMTEGTDDDAG